MTAALAPFIMRTPAVSDKMEDFVVLHVTPVLRSSEPFLRAMVSKRYEIHFTTLLTLLPGLRNCVDTRQGRFAVQE
jgi:hypothetical protein